MSTPEWILVAIILLGIIPAWLVAIAAFLSSRKPYAEKPSARYFAYARLIKAMQTELVSGQFKNGALFAARVRELKNYPEFKDLTLFFLEEIDVTGSGKFDHILRNELKTVEASLLERQDG